MNASSRPWAVKRHCLSSKVHLFARQFGEAYPNADGNDFLQSLNSNIRKLVTAYGEPSLLQAWRWGLKIIGEKVGKQQQQYKNGLLRDK